MRKRTVCSSLALLLLTVVISGCSMTGESSTTPEPIYERPAKIQQVLGDYALLAGHTLYQGADNGYSIQLPEGCEINDEDPNNVIVTIHSDAQYPNTLNIKYSPNAQVVDKESQLMEMLKDDNSIDITGFFVLNKDGAYEGYKYTFTAVSDPEFKSIKSTYFADDRSAYIITASSPNGNDDINMTNLNTVVDTFINYR